MSSQQVAEAADQNEEPVIEEIKEKRETQVKYQINKHVSKINTCMRIDISNCLQIKRNMKHTKLLL